MDISDILILLGVACMAGGLYYIYPPAAAIFGGVILLTFGLLLGRGD